MALNIQSSVPALSANRFLLGAHRNTVDAMRKLSSGYRINQAREGPAALIISELLRSQTAGFERAIRNTQEANNVLSIAEGGLNEVSSMLRNMRQLAVHAANSGVTSSSQVAADQAELNGMLSSISRIANTTRFSDQQLLNGAQGITFRATDSDAILDQGATQINEMADIAGQTFDIAFSGNPADQAEKAVVETDLGGGTTLASGQTFTVTGAEGSASFEFAAGTSIADMAASINARTGSTGVTAYAIEGDTELRLVSEAYGAEATVRVEQTAGDAFAAEGATVQEAGQNATVTVNGQAVQTDGLTLNVEADAFAGRVVFQEGTAAATTIAQTGYDQDTPVDAATARTATLGDVQGGMRLQLGEGAGAQNRDIFGIGSFALANLGRTTVDGTSFSLQDLAGGGRAALANNPEAALQVIDQAIQDVASERARIGAYQANTLQANVNSLNVALENVMATESAIRDADMAAQVTQLVRSQILEKAALMGVQSANTNAQNVLQLLGGGR